MTNVGLFRAGGISAIGGALLLGIVVLLLPRPSDPADMNVVLPLIAGSTLWVGLHVGVLVAGFFIMAGLYAVYRAMHDVPGPELARMGFTGALVGGGIFTIWAGISGVALKGTAEAWVGAAEAEKAVALRVAEAMSDVTVGLLSISLIVLFGATFILYGMAIASGGDAWFPRWMGWVAVIGGVGSVGVGLVQLYNGPSAVMTTILFPALALVIALVVLWMGVLVARKPHLGGPPAGRPPGGA